MSDIWNKRREALEELLRVAALNLAEHTGAYSFALPLPNTTPPLVVSLAPVGDSRLCTQCVRRTPKRAAP